MKGPPAWKGPEASFGPRRLQASKSGLFSILGQIWPNKKAIHLMNN